MAGDPHIVDQVTDHATRAGDKLVTPMQQPRIRAFAEALGEAAQTLEDEAWSILSQSALEDAPKPLLDLYAQVVGEVPGNLTKADLLTFVLQRAMCNGAGSGQDGASGRDLESITAMLVAVFAPSTVTAEVHAGYVRVTVSGTTALDPSILEHGGQLVHDCKPLGLAITVTEQVTAGAITFAYDTVGAGYDNGVWGSRTFDGKQRYA